ncbi:MAG: hypothetical protein HC941_21775 [Microcoleus sp. SU_5_3]|nr:hypothetical protein [Microcoleus sp. SU_5_3]
MSEAIMRALEQVDDQDFSLTSTIAAKASRWEKSFSISPDGQLPPIPCIWHFHKFILCADGNYRRKLRN